MNEKKPTYEELASRLDEVESVLKTLRSEQADALIGERCPLLLRVKEAEAALQEVAQFNQQIIMSATEGIAACDPDTRFTLWNPVMEEISGLPAEQVIGKRLLEVFPFLKERGIQALVERVMHGETVAAQDYFFHVPETGRSGWAASRFTPLRDVKGAVVGVLGTFHDVTKRKQAEEALKESEARFRALAENTPAAIFIHRGAEYCYVNPAAEGISGYTCDELLRMDFWEIAHPEFREVIRARGQARLRGEAEPTRYEAVLVTKSGEKRWIDVTARLIEFDREPAVLGSFFDITERKRADEEREKLQKQLLQAQKMEAVGRLAGGVAHDFNNMLGVILGYAESALSGLTPGDPICEDLKEIRAAAQRSADLTRQLLAFSRNQIIAPKVVRLNEQLETMERLLRRTIGEDIDLEFVLAPDLWAVRMDPVQAHQIVANLAVNSRDAMPDGGKLTIETKNVTLSDTYCREHLGFMPGEYVMLAVSDTGCGMKKETLDHIFEPFFTTKQDDKGTGLGLSTVYGIVKQNKGFINVYSEPGQGTTVKTYIPRYPEEGQVEPVTPRDTGAPGGGETVLLVEDEDQVRRLAKRMLERLGYTVLDAGSPSDAIAICEKYSGEIHLLLTDVVMPTMDGRKLQVRIAAIKPDIRVIYMSGYTANAIARRGVLEEGVHFLEKPFSQDALAKKMREVLDHG